MNIDIRHIAKLSALEFSENELAEIREDMEELTRVFSELPDTIIPVTDTERKMELRSDDIIDSEIPSEVLISLAPASSENCYSVPQAVKY